MLSFCFEYKENRSNAKCIIKELIDWKKVVDKRIDETIFQWFDHLEK